MVAVVSEQRRARVRSVEVAAKIELHTDAEPMPVDTYTRSVGMRLAIVGATRLQARDLDEGLTLGHRSLDILATVQSHRAKDYIRDLLAELTPWRHEPTARVFTHRAAQMLAS